MMPLDLFMPIAAAKLGWVAVDKDDTRKKVWWLTPSGLAVEGDTFSILVFDYLKDVHVCNSLHFGNHIQDVATFNFD